jgi:TatD DNase family protein
MSEAEITDSHCHLDFPDFEGERGGRRARRRGRGHAHGHHLHALANEPQVRAIAEAHAPSSGPPAPTR